MYWDKSIINASYFLSLQWEQAKKQVHDSWCPRLHGDSRTAATAKGLWGLERHRQHLGLGLNSFSDEPLGCGRREVFVCLVFVLFFWSFFVCFVFHFSHLGESILVFYNSFNLFFPGDWYWMPFFSFLKWGFLFFLLICSSLYTLHKLLVGYMDDKYTLWFAFSLLICIAESKLILMNMKTGKITHVVREIHRSI